VNRRRGIDYSFLDFYSDKWNGVAFSKESRRQGEISLIGSIRKTYSKLTAIYNFALNVKLLPTKDRRQIELPRFTVKRIEASASLIHFGSVSKGWLLGDEV